MKTYKVIDNGEFTVKADQMAASNDGSFILFYMNKKLVACFSVAKLIYGAEEEIVARS